MARESVWRFGVFFTIFLSLWVVLNVYVFWRASSVPYVARHVPRWGLLLAAVFLASSYILARVLERFGAGLAAVALEFVGATWMGVLFLTFAAFLVVDVLTLFGFLLRGHVPALRGGALAVAGALSLVALVQGFRAPVVVDEEVRLKELPAGLDGTVLAIVSDTHLGTLLAKGWLTARVDQVKAMKPDLVILCGDILEGDRESERELAPLLTGFSAPMGLYAVTGNHEFYAGVERSVRTLEGAGVTVLRDRAVEVRPGFILAGVDDLTARRQFLLNGDPVARTLEGRPKGATVFLSHSPWKAEEAARLGAGLMLSGHTHAGPIWPFGFITGLRYPLLAGRYEVGGLPVIVCRGTGTWGPRMRLWRPGEILRITLRAG